MTDSTQPAGDPVPFAQPTRTWFERTFGAATRAQRLAWPPICAGEHTLLVAPTGSGKTLAAFLAGLDRLMFSEKPGPGPRCQVLYISPIKALAFDIERNLKAPLEGMRQVAAGLDLPSRHVEVAMRTGDTPAADRARFSRRGADLLITTPESLYMLLTSKAAEQLRGIRTVIVDEVHAVAGTKRGTHLVLSLERLESICDNRSVQRIGLSATQRPLATVAQWLGGLERHDRAGALDGPLRARPVTIVDAHAQRALEIRVEVPAEAQLSTAPQVSPPEHRPVASPDRSSPPTTQTRAASATVATEQPADAAPGVSPETAGGPTGLSGSAATKPPQSVWSAIHPRLLALIRQHRTTMVFANNRRLTERLAAALNELAGEPVARAHHGSVARQERLQIEEALKSGQLPCLIATSSMELGLDIGSVDLVLQIESPPSVSSGVQRIGRANHQVGGRPEGALFPKHRSDLLACAEAARRIIAGEVECTSYPKNALDVLAQQAVAIVASGQATTTVELLSLVRRAAPYEDLNMAQLESVLDMLSGRYPSDDFSQLRPRLTWDRDSGQLRPRKGAQRLAIANAGVIPDRGLYGVFLTGEGGSHRRVGELDEEMVFEARLGEVFVLGASSWRIEDITHDRVLVTPAPGRPGKMPFWHGAALGRSAEFGQGIGSLVSALQGLDEDGAVALLTSESHRLDPQAARQLVGFVHEQAAPPNQLPSRHQIVVETFIDEVGDHRLCLLSALGGAVHAPLAMCLTQRLQRDYDMQVEAIWMDDGIIMRRPDGQPIPDLAGAFPSPDEVEPLLLDALSGSALFAAHFRECAGRALLLPRRSPTRRTPLWVQRTRAANLLSVAARYPSFPIVLETFRECLQDVFDLPALRQLLMELTSLTTRVTTVETRRPSPFARSLLFNYAGNFIYDTDAPLAERKAAALSVDMQQLSTLLGEADMRELLDRASLDHVHNDIARLRIAPGDPDDLHDLLLFVGDLTRAELDQRLGPKATALVEPLITERRAVWATIAGQSRLIAAEDATRYRSGLAAQLQGPVSSAFDSPVADPLGDLVARYARTHVPFLFAELHARYPANVVALQTVVDERVADSRWTAGHLHPAKSGLCYCDSQVLRAIKRRALSRLRADIEAVDAATYGRFLLSLHGIGQQHALADGLLGAVEQLQAWPVDAQELENDILPVRLPQFTGADLDALFSSGDLLWRGMGTRGESGRIALYFRDDFSQLAAPPPPAGGRLVGEVRHALSRLGAAFFADIVRELQAFPPDVLGALWTLVWNGEVTNDSLLPLRSLNRAQAARPHHAPRTGRAGSKGRHLRRALPGSEGRWSLLRYGPATHTERMASSTRCWLARHGVLMRDALKYEGQVGGFSAVYEVLKTMEDAGQVRRGYFVDGLGAAQFALPGVDDMLRGHRQKKLEKKLDSHGDPFVLAASDPASPWGATLRFPASVGSRPGRPTRSPGAVVVLSPDGRLLAFLSRRHRNLLTFTPSPSEADAQCIARALGARFASAANRREDALLLTSIDGEAPGTAQAISAALRQVGFAVTHSGYQWRGPAIR